MPAHIPVMLHEVLDIFKTHIAPDGSELFIDATLGAGGHAEAILTRFAASALIGFDQDGQARRIAGERLAHFGERAMIVPENFRGISRNLLSGIAPRIFRDPAGGANGVLFDLGVSNMQLTTPERGFSFQDDGPLDMRMSPDSGDPSAADLLAEMDLREMTRIFRDYGEERHAYRIAKGIARARESGELPGTTADLTALIRKILPAPVQRKMGTHPARRVFQALRIAVNAELEALREGLAGALEVCADGGVVVVISYHSLEDRIVKTAFREWDGAGRGRILTKKPLVPEEREVEGNRSARSAKLRAFIATKS
jgi:16S rRNA (cytosine1402-N4)-methyltransferase